MWLYLTIFFIPVLFYLFNPKGGKNTFFFASMMFFLAFFVGLTDMFGGYDRYIYGELFDNIADATHAGENPFQSFGFQFYGSEFGYGTISVIISLFTKNRYIFILIITLLFYYLLYLSIKRYTTNYFFAIILFFGLWFFFSFTYLRQILGTVVCWLSIEYAIKQDKTKFFLLVILGATIHNSALIFLPVYYFSQKKLSTSRILNIMSICFLIGITNIAGGIQGAYNSFNSAAAYHQEDDALGAEGSFRIAYAIEAVFFLFIILSNYHRFSNSRKQLTLLNMALMFCAILLLFIRSENGGRIAWYYLIGLISTITYIVHKKGVNPMLSKALIIICLFLYVRIFNSWQIYNNLYPYKTFLTNGHRTPDYSYERYEYDENYDKDKFYR